LSRAGPYACLLIALILLALAEIPQVAPGVLILVKGWSQPGFEIISRMGVGFAVTAAGFILVGLVWLVRISRLEAGLSPYLVALEEVAAPYGEAVSMKIPDGLFFDVQVGRARVHVHVDPRQDGRISVGARVWTRQPIAVLGRGVEPVGVEATWPMVGGGRGWEMRGSQPGATRWMIDDLEVSGEFDRIFTRTAVRAMRYHSGFLQVESGIVGPEAVAEEVTRALDAWSFLGRANADPSQA